MIPCPRPPSPGGVDGLHDVRYARDAHVIHVPVIIQPCRETGPAQESSDE
jgi:hypothetical protein